jgi:hypothetical protein
MRTSWAKGKKYLATLWYAGSGAMFLVILIQSIIGRYGENVNEVWEWFLPTILPTLSLIISILVMDTLGKGTKIKTVDKFMFRLALSISALYLAVLASTILMSPFASLPPVALMKQSTLWLAPFQGLVTAALGAFFMGGKHG